MMIIRQVFTQIHDCKRDELQAIQLKNTKSHALISDGGLDAFGIGLEWATEIATGATCLTHVSEDKRWQCDRTFVVNLIVLWVTAILTSVGGQRSWTCRILWNPESFCREHGEGAWLSVSRVYLMKWDTSLLGCCLTLALVYAYRGMKGRQEQPGWLDRFSNGPLRPLGFACARLRSSFFLIPSQRLILRIAFFQLEVRFLWQNTLTCLSRWHFCNMFTWLS